jgi:hypothetical protein
MFTDVLTPSGRSKNKPRKQREEGSNKFLRNFDELLPDYLA